MATSMRLGWVVIAWAMLVPAASAQWVPIGEERLVAPGILYVDPSSLHREDDLRRFWMLGDLRQAGPAGERSMRSLFEMDCTRREYRELMRRLHAGPMGRGAVLRSLDNQGWESIAAGSALDQVWAMVCKPGGAGLPSLRPGPAAER